MYHYYIIPIQYICIHTTHTCTVHIVFAVKIHYSKFRKVTNIHLKELCQIPCLSNISSCALIHVTGRKHCTRPQGSTSQQGVGGWDHCQQAPVVTSVLKPFHLPTSALNSVWTPFASLWGVTVQLGECTDQIATETLGSDWEGVPLIKD